MVSSVLASLNQKRLQQALKKPHVAAELEARRDLPPQSFSLSVEEKKRILHRLENQIKSEVLPDPLLLPKPFRPPKPVVRAKNPDKGIVIKDTAETFKNEKEDEIHNYRAVIDSPEPITIKELSQITKMMRDKTIQGLEERIYMVLHKGKDRVFKNNDRQAREPMKSFYEWVNSCYDLERFNRITIQAVDPTFSISRAIVDLMFFMSQWKPNEMAVKFQAFEEILSLVDRGEDTVVTCRILDLLNEAELRLRRKKDSSTAAVTQEVRAQLQCAASADDDNDLKESFLDSIMFRLLEGIFQLELFWGYKRLPWSRRFFIEAFPSLENELSTIEASMMDIELQMEDSVELASLKLNWRNTESYSEMQVKIFELWQGLER